MIYNIFHVSWNISQEVYDAFRDDDDFSKRLYEATKTADESGINTIDTPELYASFDNLMDAMACDFAFREIERVFTKALQGSTDEPDTEA